MEWSKAKYPGDAVRIDLLRRGDELGDVRVQWYTDKMVRVASFLPGRIVDNPGDTPKVEPERDEWCETKQHAEYAFATFVRMAHDDGWEPMEAYGASHNSETKPGVVKGSLMGAHEYNTKLSKPEDSGELKIDWMSGERIK